MPNPQTILEEYYEALERLKNARPKKVAKGSRINNDTVAQEAGRRKGSIKKSRPVFAELIEAIKAASSEQTEPARDHKSQVDRLVGIARKHQEAYEVSLMRELSLRRMLDQLAKEKKSKSAKVIRLHR